MTPKTLRELLLLLDQPFDPDHLRLFMSQVTRAAERERDGLRERVPHAVKELRDAAADAERRAEEVGQIDERTRGGFIATMLSSVDADGIQDKRDRAARALAGDIAVLERRMEDARALAAQARELHDTIELGVRVLAGLGARAAAADVDAESVASIDPALRTVAGVPGHIRGVASPLDSPVRDAHAVAHHATRVLTTLRSSGRASTVGEALLDGVVSPDAGAFGQAVRSKAASAAPGLVPELDRDAMSVAEAHAEIESERSSARERARRDAEARRAAEAELDALDRD